ncbi:MAG: sigma-70 family RNA polymerase sigma factor [Bacteroidota bacterium]
MIELKRIRAGDKESVQILYDKCFPSISNWIKKNSGTEKEAEDIFQEALIAVYQKSKDPNFQLNCKLSTFIFGVAKKMWLHKLRTKHRHVYTDFTESEELSQMDEEAADKMVLDAEVDQVYTRNFSKLTKECKKVLTMFFNGSSMKEIVKHMNFPSESFARKRKFNCKNELIKLVKSDPLYDELREKEI